MTNSMIKSSMTAIAAHEVISSYIMAAGMADKTIKVDSRGCSSQGYSTIRDVVVTL